MAVKVWFAKIQPMSQPKNRSVVAVVYDQLCGLEFGVACELFGLERPELGVDWYEFSAVAIDAGAMAALGGVTFNAPTDLAPLSTAGTIVLPGWRNPHEPPPDDLVQALLDAHSKGARIMSICSGVFILAATGLLDGLAATTHWRYTDQLSSMYSAIDVRPDVLYIDNGSTLTSAGSAAGLDLGLHLIRRDYGADVANRVARRLVIAPQRSGGQAQFIDTPMPEVDSPSIAPTAEWAAGRLGRAMSVTELAAHAKMSPRTFARRFRTDMGLAPHQWLVRQRIAMAQRLLETTQLSIEAVANECGFGSAATLRHHFHHSTRTTPSDYRAAFSRVG